MAAVELVVQVAEHRDRAVADQGVDVPAQGRRLRRAPEEPVGRVARPFALVPRGEAVRPEREQLRLQVAGDDRDAGGRERGAERAAAHGADRRAAVVGLHRRQPRRERAHLRDVREPRARGEADPDPALVGELGEHDLPAPAGGLEHVVERRGVADLLHGEDVGRDVGDPGAECGHLRAVRALVVGPVPAARPEQVLEVPRREQHGERPTVVQSAAMDLIGRCRELAAVSEEAGALTRPFATPAMARANALVAEWMEQAGMSTRTDAAGNLVGRLSGPDLGGRHAPARLAPRHRARRRRLRRPARRRRRRSPAWRSCGRGTSRSRSPSTSTASPTRRACATAPPTSARARSRARFDPELFALADAEGIHLRDALTAFGGDPVGDRVGRAARTRSATSRSTSSRARCSSARARPLGRRHRDRRADARGGRLHRRGRARGHGADGGAARRGLRARRVRPRRRGGGPRASRAWSPPSAASPRCAGRAERDRRGRRRRRSTSAIPTTRCAPRRPPRCSSGRRRSAPRASVARAAGSPRMDAPAVAMDPRLVAALAEAAARRAAPAQRRGPRRGRARRGDAGGDALRPLRGRGEPRAGRVRRRRGRRGGRRRARARGLRARHRRLSGAHLRERGDRGARRDGHRARGRPAATTTAPAPTTASPSTTTPCHSRASYARPGR